MISEQRIKRATDVALASGGLILALPVLLPAALVVRLTMGSPVLFRQERTGLSERPFVLLKLRTMRTSQRDFDPSTDAVRLTPLGRLLRASSVDELPSLWNVLRGDMSLVGPRPLPTAYLPRYSAQHRRRHEVRPGLTGLAQVSGRNELSWEERFDLDVAYVDTRSLVGDLQILLKTVASVLSRRGISAAGAATMTEYLGPAHRERG